MTKIGCGFFVLLCFVAHISSVPLKHKKAQCGYAACTGVDPDALNVHLIAHSHDDVGWLKTVDQYYYGSNSSIQLAGVQYIIDSVIRALPENPERKFIQVETAFFYKWWNQQSDKIKNQVLNLIQNGQLEIIGGAWSMNDEAVAHYHSIVDQFTFGLKTVEDILGECGRPKIGWQIDPFGHTREMASIFAQLGYDALFFARLDWRDKGERLKTKTGEMLWRGSANLGDDSLLFTHVMYNHYSPPPGFYFDVLSNDDPLIPDQESVEYNLEAKVEDFRKYVDKQSESYPTNNIMIAMGNDFTYQDAHYNYKNLDILIKAFRDSEQQDSKGRRINLLYSTPSCYLKAVNDHAKKEGLSFPIKTDDFIPYASDYHTYWSGYYTSRPTQKRFERQGNNLLQVTKQLTTFAGADVSGLDDNLFDLKSAMGIMQHHDAITGTEKQHVAEDYARIVMKAFAKSHKNVNAVVSKLLAKNKDNPINVSFDSCLLANVTHCDASKGKQFLVALHNPLSRTVSHHVRLPVDSNKFTITDAQGNEVEWQVTPSIADFSYVENIKPSKLDLVFLAEDLPPLGIKLYYVTNDAFGQPAEDIPPVETDDRFNLGNEKLGVKLDPNTGFTSTVSANGVEVNVKQELMYYIGAQGNNMVFENRSSGAYIFRPDPKDSLAKPFTTNLLDNLKVYKGKLVDEAHQTFNGWNKQIVRVYKHKENHVELDWLVGPIDISHNESIEVISRFTSDLETGDKFYTDSNGREMLARKNNHRATYPFSEEEPISGNYYPITASISLTDKNRGVEMAVLNDRAQGGASLTPGEVELMVHRRLLKDDAFGVGEALNEREFGQGLVVRGQHYLTVGSTNGNAKKNQRDIAQRKLLAPWAFVADLSNEDIGVLKAKINSEFAGLQRDLPDQVQILTVEPWRDGTVLLRFEHILERNEGGEDVSFNLDGLFTLFEVTGLQETTLGANQKLEDNKRLEWKAGDCLPGLDDCTRNEIPKYIEKNTKANEISLSPMQIRTYIATVKFH